MRFKKFQEFLDGKLAESHLAKQKNPLNRHALDYEKKLAELNGRFDNPREAQRVILMAGYGSIGEFINDSDEMKWCKLKIPGQENYRK